MSELSSLQWLALLLISAALLISCVRLLLGPTTPDRVVAADTLAVITTAGLCWLALHFASALYLDIALAFGALAFVGVVAIARTLEGRRQ